jgi:hypothetical protein
MSDHLKIEWRDATWNPLRGGSKISPGGFHGYAETFAERFRGVADNENVTSNPFGPCGADAGLTLEIRLVLAACAGMVGNHTAQNASPARKLLTDCFIASCYTRDLKQT